MIKLGHSVFKSNTSALCVVYDKPEPKFVLGQPKFGHYGYIKTTKENSEYTSELGHDETESIFSFYVDAGTLILMKINTRNFNLNH